MEKDLLVYKCDICGYVLLVMDKGQRVMHEEGEGYTKTLTIANAKVVCCDKPMRLLTPNTKEAAFEKHLPVARFEGDKLIVNVGSMPHPMTKEHSIKWIAIVYDNCKQCVELTEYDDPQAVFTVKNVDTVKVYSYCNLHGLWLTEVTR